MASVSPSGLVEFASGLLVRGGASEADAALVAEALVWADRRGRAPQGTVWIEPFVDRLRAGSTRSPAEVSVVDERPSLVVLDGGGGFGHVAAERAVELAADRASTQGVAVVAVRNSSHFGACGRYAERLAERGLLGLVATNAYPKVAPHGGRRPVLGTNPLGFAAPAADGPPLRGDLATGAVAGSRVRHALATGEPLDPGVALDAEGRPTTDARRFSDGGVMLPVGGAKGTALGLLVELLTSVLAGGDPPWGLGSMFDPGRPAGTSHVVLAMGLPAGGPAQVSALGAAVEATPAREGMAVRLPGTAGDGPASSDTVALGPDTVESLARVATAVGAERPGWLSRASAGPAPPGG